MRNVQRPLLLVAAGTSGCLLLAGLLATVTGAASTLVRPAWADQNCITEGSTLSLDSTAYAVTPREAVDGLGERTVDMIWYDRDNSDQVTITVSTEATEVRTLTDPGCGGIVTIPVDVTLTSASRRIDEVYEGDARIRLDDDLWTVIIDWTQADNTGSLQAPPENNNDTFERFGYQIRFGEESTLGGIRAEFIRDNGSKRYVALGLIGGDSQTAIEDELVIETDPPIEPVEVPATPGAR